MKHQALTLLLAYWSLFAFGHCVARASQDNLIETHRIRVTNSVDGAVQVSVDRGASYVTVGRVNRPATACLQGFAASAFAQDGRIAAIAVHAIRIRSGSLPGRDAMLPRVFSIIPREFASPGGDFGTGEIAGASGIYTDIPAGISIFRNLSPVVGNPVLLERGRTVRPLPRDYVPNIGDSIVIVAQTHVRRPREIIIENRAGGSVQAVYADANETIAIVEHPVLGVGRFDATEYTGVGCINTNHTGVVTISTAPVMKRGGGSSEPRGGFQILPSKHARHIGWIPQYMIVAPPAPGSVGLEGTPLLFSSYLSLDYDPESPTDSLLVDVRIGSGDWRPLSALVGKQDDAFLRFPGTGQPVTHFRIRLPSHAATWIAEQLKSAAASYLAAKYGKKPPTTGLVTVSVPSDATRTAAHASFYVDGAFRGISNTPPFSFSVDTAKLPPGEHVAELRASDSSGGVTKSVKRWFYTIEP